MAMQLTDQEKSKAWWGGALSGVAKAVPQGLVIGLVASAVLFFGAVPLMAAMGISMAPVFGLFIATGAGAYTPLPMILFNIAILGISNAVNGGSAAVDAYHQQKHNAMSESRISALEQQLHMPAPARSQAVDRILAQGPRGAHAHAEPQRSENPSSPTRH